MAGFSLRKRIILAFGLLMVCLGTLIAFAARHYSELVEAQGWSSHTYQVLAVLRDLESTLNSDRGLPYCAATGDKVFMRSQVRIADYETSRSELQTLVHDNDLQQQRLIHLDRAWSRWQTEFLVPLQAMCDIPPGARRPALTEAARLGETGNQLRNEVRSILQAMDQAEQQLLKERLERLESLQAVTASILTTLAGVTLILAIGSGYSLIRAASRQDRLNHELAEGLEQRRLVERRLKDSEMRVRAVIENVPDGIVTTDARGVIQSFNSSAELIFGYQADRVIGHNINMLMAEPDRAAHDGWMERYASTGESQVIGKRRELTARRSTGERFPIDLAITEIWIDGERTFTGIVRDISDFKRHNEEIKRFKTVLDNTLDMIFMFDPVTLDFVYVNRGAIESMGYTREQLMTMHASDVTPAMPEHVFRSHIAQLLSGGKPWLNYETTYQRRDGQEVPVEIFLQLVREDRSDAGLFIAIARDLTERRRIDQMKSEFISIVSHELRTPLTSIRGSLGLLVGGVAGELPERSKRMVEIAHHNSERLVRLINDMLDMEKIDSGKMRFDLRPLSVGVLIQQALDANSGYGTQHQVEFVADPVAPEIRVYADADRLMQVLANLMSNAAKFSPAGGKVRLSVTTGEGMVRVSVIDKGPGIPAAFRDRVFERFSQADASDTRQKGGTGLGLSICKAIVERHDGSMGFDNPVSGGTIFWFQVPAWIDPVAVVPQTKVHDTRILVCEDDGDVAAVMAMLLRHAGYAVDIAYTAGEARQRLKTTRYAAMTLDVHLPDEDGVSLIRGLTAEGVRVPPIVVVSRKASEEAPQILGGRPVLDWIDKPIDQPRLLASLRRALHGEREHLDILHVEDDPDVRRVLATLVGEQIAVTGVASAAEARQLLATRPFDLVVLDVGLTDASGLDLLPYFLGPNAATPVLLFSAHDPSPEVQERVAAALVKSRTSNQQLLDTIRRLVSET